jgi:polyketide cyclase/dehydrase/lipid transport protein
MSVRLDVSAEVDATVEVAWQVLIDWAGQSSWIPLTTVKVVNDRAVGLGARLEALSGVRVGRIPVGLLDRFIVTGWSPPADGMAELEIFHLGPYFTGEGVFRLTGQDGKTKITCVEAFSLPGGRAVEWLAELLLPIMRAGFAHSLRRFAAIAEAR